MSLLERVHRSIDYPRRLARLSAELARAVPRDARVLDVGSGDGALAAALAERRPDISVEGIDVLLRPKDGDPGRPLRVAEAAVR